MPTTSATLRENLGPEKLAVGWPWRLFLFSLLVLVVVGVLYVGLESGYKIYLNDQIGRQDQAIEELSQSISAEDQEKFIAFYSQLANLQALLDNHQVTAGIFPFLEEKTNRFVYYDFVDFKPAERKLVLEGVALSYEVLAQQLEAFNRAREVEGLVVQESQSVGNRVQFRLSLILKQ
jgi:hypothetical protein